MPYLAFLHGLNSSHHSFNYIAKELGAESKVNYKSTQALEKSVLQVSKQLPKKEPIILVGHSLGGLVALSIALNKTHQVQKVVTISSPLGGSSAAIWMRWLVQSEHVFHDITPGSAAVRRFGVEPAPCQVLSIVSTGGNIPLVREPNDTVVTVRSQKALPYAKKIEVKANHFEILMRDETVKHIKTFIES